MPTYAYKCRECRYRLESPIHGLNHCPECGYATLGRDYSSVNLAPPAFRPHFNHAVGEYVHSSRDLDDAFKIKSEQQSIRTGADHNYVRLDPGDVPTPTKDTDILETRNRNVRDKGIREMGEVK